MKCVLFDLDGTLYQSEEYSRHLDDQISGLISEMLGVSREQAEDLLRQGKSKFGTLTRTLESLGIDRERFFTEIARRTDINAYLKKDSTLGDLMRTLRQRGFRIGLVSNSGSALVHKILQSIDLPVEQLDVVVTSSDAAPKPSKEPFIVALRQIGSDAESSIYVGDRDEQELRPAKELGIRTVLVNVPDRYEAKWADYVVHSLAELPELLDQFEPDRKFSGKGVREVRTTSSP